MGKINPFDYNTSINSSKKDLMRGTANDRLAEKSYVPFLTNRALSYHHDALAFANEMNLRSQIDNLLQYDFYLNIIRPKKRYAKWFKKSAGEEINIIKEYYGYNNTNAQQALSILNENQLALIKVKLQKGGMSNDREYD